MSTISNPADLRKRGTEVLVRELGFADAMRFLHQFDNGRGDYTEERQQLLPDMPADELIRRADEEANR